MHLNRAGLLLWPPGPPPDNRVASLPGAFSVGRGIPLLVEKRPHDSPLVETITDDPAGLLDQQDRFIAVPLSNLRRQRDRQIRVLSELIEQIEDCDALVQQTGRLGNISEKAAKERADQHHQQWSDDDNREYLNQQIALPHRRSTAYDWRLLVHDNPFFEEAFIDHPAEDTFPDAP